MLHKYYMILLHFYITYTRFLISFVLQHIDSVFPYRLKNIKKSHNVNDYKTLKRQPSEKCTHKLCKTALLKVVENNKIKMIFFISSPKHKSRIKINEIVCKVLITAIRTHKKTEYNLIIFII